MNIHKLTKILIVISFAVALFGGGYKLGEYQAKTLQPKKIVMPQNNLSQKNIDFKLFFDTWDKVEKKFVDKKKIDPQKMYEGAIKGMVASLGDPYTFFLTPDENKQSKDDLGGKFEGIGAQLGLENNAVVVIAPIKNSPALKAGLLSGDIILKVDGESTNQWSFTQTVSKIRGPKGTKVTLDILRKNKEMQFVITRDEIQVDSVELSFEGNIAVLKLVKFGDDTNRLWDTYVNQISSLFNSQKITGLILDLRDNPGGYLQSAAYIASEFLPYGKLIVEQKYSDNSSEKYIANRHGKLLKIPLVALINKGSASASEILSGALRDYGRATLVGENSFGKGSVQEAMDLAGGAGLHVTVAKWILPKGDWINGKGIKPDVEVINDIPEGNTVTRETDSQMKQALEILKEKTN